jgi:hypothetical protein
LADAVDDNKAGYNNDTATTMMSREDASTVYIIIFLFGALSPLGTLVL